MRILVTGGAGRLGYIVTKLFLEKGYKVRAFDLPQVNWSHVESLESIETFKGDITDPKSVEKSCENIDAVVHLAALLPPRSEVNHDLTIKVNVTGTENILKGTNSEVSIVLASTISTYGITAHVQPPVKESSTQKAHNSYSESKIAAEKLIKETDNPSRILRIAPISVSDLVELPDVIPYRADQRVEFVFVEDAAIAIVSSLEACNDKEVYNIAGGQSWQMTGEEYINRFYSALGVEVEPNFSQEYTAVDWYDTERSKKLGYQRTSFNKLEKKLEALSQELGLR